MNSSQPDLFACAAFDFAPSVADELELQAGCVVKILNTVDEFWYFGQNLQNGLTGLFPRDFVNILVLPDLKKGESFLFALDTFYPEEKSDLPFKKGDLLTLSYKVDEAWGYGFCKGKEGIFPLNYTQRLITSSTPFAISTNVDKSKVVCIVKAKMPLSAQIEGELSFDVGDSIAITELMPDEWALGYIGELSGTFPLSFTSYEDDLKYSNRNALPHDALLDGGKNFKNNTSQPSQVPVDAFQCPASSTSTRTPLESDCSKLFSNPEEPLSLSELQIQSNSKTKPLLSKSVSAESPFLKQGISNASTGSDSGYNSNDLKERRKNKHFVVANCSYVGRNSAELSFDKGVVIEVLEYKSDMWLYGKFHESLGYVSQNCVSEYTASCKAQNGVVDDDILSKFKATQLDSSSAERKGHAKQALIAVLRQHADVRLVIKDFQALTDFEMSVNVGDTVHVLQHVNNEWSEVKNNNGNVGFVPNSCLQQVKTQNSKSNLSNPTRVNEKEMLQNSDALKSRVEDESQYQPSPLPQNTLESATSVISSTPNPVSSTNKLSASDSNTSEASSGIAQNRRHSYHQHKVKSQRKVVSKSQSMQYRKVVKTTNETAKKPDVPSADLQVNANTASNNLRLPKSNSSNHFETDSFSVTSQESRHSSTIPSSSSCSSASSSRPSLISRSETLSNESRNKRVNRAPPHQHSSSIQPELVLPSSTSSNIQADTQIKSLPARPPQPLVQIENHIPIVEESIEQPSERKLKIEKIRSEMEEYSRMKKNLENDYNNTFDGKTRQGISEEKEFVVVKLKRLRKELQNLITTEPPSNSNGPAQLPPNEATTPPVPPVLPLLSPEENQAEIKEKRRIKRSHVIRELIKTEQDYLQDVVITIDDIMKPLMERELPSDIKLGTIFGNIEDVRDCSMQLLNSMKEADRKSSQDQVASSEIDVGKVFIENAARMKAVYKIYCRNHDDAIALLEKYDDDPEFQVPVQEYLSHVKNKVNTFDLGSFLIKPVQRILKYPLLIQELFKLTDVPHPGEDRKEYDELITAVKLVQEVANDINEDKRRKDLVRKYRKVSTESRLSGKISRFSLHSVKKKSARISLRLGHVTGLNQPETVDETFKSHEQRFKNLEKGVKGFLQNSDSFGNRYRDLLNLERRLVEHVNDAWASDRSSLTVSYCAAMRRTAEHLYRQFHNQTQFRVNTPLNTLLQQFKGPQALIEKRYDKLLDYENCQKSSDSKEKIQMAKNVYEALNQQLIDELPTLCDCGCKLLETCVAISLHLQIKFQQSMLEVLEPVLKSCRVYTPSSELDKKRMMENFNAERNQVLVDMRRFTIIPASFSAVTSSSIGSHAQPVTSGNSSFYSPPSLPTQTQSEKDSLLKKYKTDDLFVATTSYTSADKISLSCSSGDVIGVIVRKDPLGNSNKWFCDSGVDQGFLPSNILNSYSSHVNLSPPSSSPSKSPTPSLSSGSGHADSALSSKNRSSVKRASSSSSAGAASMKSLERRVADDRSRRQSATSGSARKTTPDVVVSRRREFYRLDFDFAPRCELELSVSASDVVELVEPHDKDGNSEWWLVANEQGKRGYVPANYTSKIEYL